MAKRVWEDFNNVFVKGETRYGKNATIKVENADNTTSTISLTELAALDGIAAADLAKIDGITNGTQAAGKAVVADANVNTGVSKVTQLWIGASGSEVQVNATPAEIDRATDISARVVTTTATALSLTITQHAERVVLINTNSTVANTFTLPVATGSGARFTLINNIQQTQGTVVVAANGTLDTLTGVAIIADTTAETAGAFLTTATSDKLSMNLTTTGGLGGDTVELLDGAANVWTVRATLTGSGTLASPFSQT